MQFGHCALRTLFKQNWHAVGGVADRAENDVFFGTRRARQHVVDDVRLLPGMAHADPQSPEAIADMRDRIAQAVVTAVAPAEFQTQAAHRQIEFIVRNKYLLGGNLEELAELTNREAAAIHISSRLQQDQFLGADRDARRLTRILAVIA